MMQRISILMNSAFLFWLIYDVWSRRYLRFADLSVGSPLPLLCSSVYDKQSLFIGEAIEVQS